MAGEIRAVGVVGLGTMGAGIVEVFARNGLPVTALEIDDAALERGRATLRSSTDRAVSRGKLTAEQAEEILSRVSFSTSYPDLAGADLVVEAAPERMGIKRQIFTELDRVCPAHTILATNTSSLSVTEIGHHTARPDRVLGMHFFNPAPIMKLVEVISTVSTDPDVTATVTGLARSLGKTPVSVTDRAGFVANYLLLGYLNQAAWLLQDRYVERAELDEAMRLGAGLPMGPLTLMDLIGIDTIVEILDTIHAYGGGSRRHATAPLLRQLTAAGMLGRKTGEGFYRYQKPGSGKLAEGEAAPAATAGAAPRAVAVFGDPAAVEAFEQAGIRVAVLSEDDPSVPSDVDLVVCGERTPVEVFGALGKSAPAGAVLAVDSSTASVVERGMASGVPERVVGFHLVGQFVEIVRSVRTADDAVAAGRAAAAALGRTAAVVGERAGLVVDALLVPYLNDAVGMLAAGYADADGIDAAMTLGCGYPEGPIALADRLGPARVLHTAAALHRESGEPGVAPAPLL
ncbi:MAG: 3-hydroxyacyl-CoA dehydrogenase NAD-binding domain-containing protein, partial [Actinocatenispora sp.]